MRLSKNKKAQLGIADAPMIVLIVGLVFLLMATLAFIGEKYGEAMPTIGTRTVNNETLDVVNATGINVAKSGLCNFGQFAATEVTHEANGTVIPATNYTTTVVGNIAYVAESSGGGNNATDWNVTYTYTFSGSGCNVTTSLQTELLSNTSIAGIVLTIALVGIVLTILIGIFVGFRSRRI